jgi:glycosyltransferase involved in cell wall biosynthesis
VDVLSCGELDPVTRGAVRQVTQVPGVVRRRRTDPVLRRLETLSVAAGAGPEEVWGAADQRRQLARLLGDGAGYDLVCVEHAAFARLLPDAPRRGRWAITLHNVASARARQQQAVTAGRRQRWALERGIRQAQRLESWVLSSYDVTVSVSELDAALLPGPSVVVPNGVDTARFPDTPVPAAPHVVFLGALMTPPNVDGACWLAEEIWPRVLAEVPEATLSLVGRDPTAEVLALGGRPGISVVPNPPDVLEHLLHARVSVVPLRIGSGTRLKALEGMASRRPVVGTTIGLEGLHVSPGRDVVLADDVDTFSTELVHLLTDDAAAHRYAAAGRKVVEREYDWATVGRAYTQALLRSEGIIAAR